MMLIHLVALLIFQSETSSWEARVHRSPSAANYRNLAAAYENQRAYPKASSAYFIASTKYAKLGDPNAAKVLLELGKRYQTVAQLFVERTEDPAHATAGFTARRLEPESGCYLGANIEREDATRYPQSFNNAIGKRHAFFFTYRRYGMPFPTDYARELKKAHAGLQLAYEPRSLQEVNDDEYLHQFAQTAARSGIPVFLRFASEMNGDWTSYHGNPAEYIAKFRLVSRVMHDEAPNVAMVWCPNETPEADIDRYYPGQDATDWVGVNFYSVLYNDGDRSRGAEWRNPVDAIDYVYRTYSARHPIMVGEWAASHRSVVDNRERPDFAVDKIGQFYTALPRLYPRVKAVHWLSMDTMRYAEGTRKLNDFSLLSNDEVAKAYGEAISSDWFLGRAPEAEPPQSPVRYEPLKSGATVSPDLNLSAYVRSYDNRPRVAYIVDGKRYDMPAQPGPYTLSLHVGHLGAVSVVLEVKDASGVPVSRKTVRVTAR